VFQHLKEKYMTEQTIAQGGQIVAVANVYTRKAGPHDGYSVSRVFECGDGTPWNSGVDQMFHECAVSCSDLKA
jgi:hypothetical protein